MEKRQASSFYPHFAENERPTVDRLVGLFNRLVFKHENILTSFLNPGERDILKTIVGNEAYLQEFGGYPQAEKKRVYISEDWESIPLTDFKVQTFAIEYPKKFVTLTHSSILGTLANSGVETETFGDIINDDQGHWQFFADKDLERFFTEQIDRIGRSKVTVKPISLKNVLIPEDDSIEKVEIVPSLRFDAVLAGVSKQSRAQIKREITSGTAKLNWHETTNSNIMVKEMDVLSLRHFGRVQLMDISATKKGKFRVVLKLWQTRKRK